MGERDQQIHMKNFQKLFDVPSLTGVYPRMNEVYTRLGELNNAVRNLQELLELGNDSFSFLASHLIMIINKSDSL